MTSNMVRFLAGMAGLCAVAISGGVAQATVYTIDSSQSFLSITVYDANSGTQYSLPQFTGSDTASLGGTVDASLGGGNITFAPTSITFGTQSGIYPDVGGGNPVNGTTSPLPDLPPTVPNIGGSQTANYGLQFLVDDASTPLDPNYAAIAGYAALNSALASLTGSNPFAGGSFATTGLTVTTTAGNLDYNLNFGNGDYDPPNQNFQTGSPNAVLPPGTTSIGGNSGAISGDSPAGSLSGNTITIPIVVHVPIDVSIATLDVVFTGQIVATAVPEPSTVALAGLGLIALIPAVRRGLRKA